MSDEVYKEALVLNKSIGDYSLKPDATDVSICIRNIRVYIRLANWGVHVAMESLIKEIAYPLTSTWLSFDEAGKNTYQEASPNKHYFAALLTTAVKYGREDLSILVSNLNLPSEVEMDIMCEEVGREFRTSITWEYKPTYNETNKIQLTFRF